MSQLFNDFFSNAVLNHNIEENNFTNMIINEDDPILRAIYKYEQHPSIIKIKNAVGNDTHFSFSHIDNKIIINEIYSMNTSKANPQNSIPASIMKENCDIFSEKMQIDFLHAIDLGIFPNTMKNADVSPVFKKGGRLNICNYGPVSILPSDSKIFEKLMFSQIKNYIDPFLSIYQCGFCKGMSAQNGLLFMLEKWKKCLDEKGSAGILLTDLSKAFDCLIHDLLLAKLNAYGFDYMSIKLLYSYLTERFQRVRVNSNYSLWSKILFGVPQGSILGPLLFNIYLSDLFFVF